MPEHFRENYSEEEKIKTHFVDLTKHQDVKVQVAEHMIEGSDTSLEKKLEELEENFKLENIRAMAMMSENNELIGFAWMHEIFEKDLGKENGPQEVLKPIFNNNRKVLYIDVVGLIEKWRGQGLGEELLKNLLEEGNKDGPSNFVLSTTPKHHIPAYNLYHKFGFVDYAERQPKEKGRLYMVLETDQEKQK